MKRDFGALSKLKPLFSYERMDILDIIKYSEILKNSKNLYICH
jgi:hypothetical protein